MEGGRGLAGAGPLLLGLDTGGTFTDAVLWREGAGIVAKAKALTTHGNLAEGLAEAIDRVIAAAGVPPEAIALVSMSTTLATNALVEGKGKRVALVLIGFDPAEAARGDLAAALDGDPVIRCRAATTRWATPGRWTSRRWPRPCRACATAWAASRSARCSPPATPPTNWPPRPRSRA